MNKDAKQLSRDSPGQSPCPFPLLQGGSLVLRVINCNCRWGRVFHGKELRDLLGDVAPEE